MKDAQPHPVTRPLGEALHNLASSGHQNTVPRSWLSYEDARKSSLILIKVKSKNYRSTPACRVMWPQPQDLQSPGNQISPLLVSYRISRTFHAFMPGWAPPTAEIPASDAANLVRMQWKQEITSWGLRVLPIWRKARRIVGRASNVTHRRTLHLQMPTSWKSNASF